MILARRQVYTGRLEKIPDAQIYTCLVYGRLFPHRLTWIHKRNLFCDQVKERRFNLSEMYFQLAFHYEAMFTLEVYKHAHTKSDAQYRFLPVSVWRI